MNNTFADKLNYKMSVQCLYTKNLKKHVKISDNPNIAHEMDDYIREQVDNGNYIPINIYESRKKYQLHFVGYNFIVSATSSSTKVRMTTDSYMLSESGLSLNDITKPAPARRRS